MSTCSYVVASMIPGMIEFDIMYSIWNTRMKMLDQLEKLKEGKENNEYNLAEETTNAVSPISPIVRSPFRESNRQSSGHSTSIPTRDNNIRYLCLLWIYVFNIYILNVSTLKGLICRSSIV